MTPCSRRSRPNHAANRGCCSWRAWSAPERWSRSSGPSFRSRTRARGAEFYHLAQAGFLPGLFGRRQCAAGAPAPAVYLVGVIALATAAFPPNERHGRVHLPDQRLSRAPSCCIPAPSAAPGPALGAKLSRPRRFAGRGRGAVSCRFRSWCPVTSSRHAPCRVAIAAIVRAGRAVRDGWRPARLRASLSHAVSARLPASRPSKEPWR